MTKMFEEYWRGEVSGALEYFMSQPARGEFTLVVEGKRHDDEKKWEEVELLDAIRREMKLGKKAKDLAAELAEKSGWARREIYQRIVKS